MYLIYIYIHTCISYTYIYTCISYTYIYTHVSHVQIPLMQCVLNTTLCDKVISDLRQVGAFLKVLWFTPPIKLTAMI